MARARTRYGPTRVILGWRCGRRFLWLYSKVQWRWWDISRCISQLSSSDVTLCHWGYIYIFIFYFLFL